jgi:hypothetical protein
MNEQMNKWDSEVASEGERKVAAKINQVAGYV